MRPRRGRLPGRALSSRRLPVIGRQDRLESKTTILTRPDPALFPCSVLNSHHRLCLGLSGRNEMKTKTKVTLLQETCAADSSSRPLGTGLWRLKTHSPIARPAPPPAPGRHKHGRGSSWHRRGSGTERSSIMNTKSASDKGYHFQTPCSLTCTSALPFIIAFSLPFHCHLLCQGKYELRLRL